MRREHAPPEDGAEILFFTGVRYVQLLDDDEIVEDAAAESAAPEKTRLVKIVAERLQA
jgi:hypothetical protein